MAVGPQSEGIAFGVWKKHSIMGHRFFFACAFLLLFVVCKSVTAHPTYALKKYDLPLTKDYSFTGTIVEVYERHARKIVWRQFFRGGCDDVIWSRDHRTVVFTTASDKPAKPAHIRVGFKLVVWRAGERTKIISNQDCERFDYIEDFYWSLDNQHLMIRTGSSGAADIDEGVLWCLNPNTGKADFVSGDVAGPDWIKPYWKTDKVFIYWHLLDVENPPSGELHHKVSKKPNQYVCR